jgi:hypothetical protein
MGKPQSEDLKAEATNNELWLPSLGGRTHAIEVFSGV